MSAAKKSARARGSIAKAAIAQVRAKQRHELEQELEDDRDPVADMLAEFGVTGNKVRLRRHDEKRRQWDYVDTIDLTPELLDDVREQFGGGTYRALVYDGQRYVRGGSFTFSIVGKPKLPDDGTTPPADDRLARLEAKLEQHQQQRPNSIAETVTMITSIVAAVTPLVKPLLESKSNNGGNVVETLTLLQQAEEKGERRGRAYGRLEAGTGDSMSDVAGKYLPPLLAMLQDGMSRNRNPAPVAVTPAPAAAPAPGAPALSPAPDTHMLPAVAPEYDWLPGLRPFYSNLMAQARNDSDPNVIADFALTQMDERRIRAIEICVKRDDFLPTMHGELAEIATSYPDWVRDFLGRIIEVSTPEPETKPASKSTGGRKR